MMALVLVISLAMLAKMLDVTHRQWSRLPERAPTPTTLTDIGAGSTKPVLTMEAEGLDSQDSDDEYFPARETTEQGSPSAAEIARLQEELGQMEHTLQKQSSNSDRLRRRRNLFRSVANELRLQVTAPNFKHEPENSPDAGIYDSDDEEVKEDGKKCSFFKLPRELRDEIYLEVCCDRIINISDSIPKPKTPCPSRPGLIYDLPLAQVCRQVRQEVTHTANATYTTNDFHFAATTAFFRFIVHLSSEDAAAITKIRINMSPTTIFELRSHLYSVRSIVCQTLTGLTQLELHFKQPIKYLDSIGKYEAEIVRTYRSYILWCMYCLSSSTLQRLIRTQSSLTRPKNPRSNVGAFA